MEDETPDQTGLSQRVLMDENPPVCDKLLVNFADDSTVIFQGVVELSLLSVLLTFCLGWSESAGIFI